MQHFTYVQTHRPRQSFSKFAFNMYNCTCAAVVFTHAIFLITFLIFPSMLNEIYKLQDLIYSSEKNT